MRGCPSCVLNPHVPLPPLLCVSYSVLGRQRITVRCFFLKIQHATETSRRCRCVRLQTIKDQAALEERYTVDGNKFFDTIAAMNTYLEDKRTKAGLVEGRTPIKDEVWRS